jgi:hypothetical protein
MQKGALTSAPFVYTPVVGLALAGEVHAFPSFAKSAKDGAPSFIPCGSKKPVDDCYKNKGVARVGHPSGPAKPQNGGLWKTLQEPIDMRN